MTIEQLRDQIRTLRAQAHTMARQLGEAATNEQTPLDQLERGQRQLIELNNRLGALQLAYDAQAEAEGQGMSDPAPAPQGLDKRGRVRQMLGSNEYARAFAYAIRHGVIPSRAGGDPNCQVLYNALTEVGGTPEGEDGGFLVPEDIDHTIHELRRALNPLAGLFTQETVSTNKGWRVMDKAPSTGFAKLDAELSEIPQDDQPAFGKVTYSLDTYALILPVSNELAADEVASLFSYLARWFAKKHVITENLILKAVLETLPASNITTDDPVNQIKRVLNVTLDPAISLTSVLLTNQDGYDYLDSLKDAHGRPLLQPDPTNETINRFKGRTVHVVSNAVLPSRTVTTAGATKGDYYPLYIGNCQQLATLFTRQGLEIRSTDIGGNAFHTNSIEVRGVTRLGAAKFDADAVARREIFIPATA